MKRLFALPLLALAACDPGRGTLIQEPEEYVLDRPSDVLEIDEPEGEVEYMALCVYEGRSLTDWGDSAGAARSAADDHLEKGRSHVGIVVWRQKPAPAYRAVPFAGPSDSRGP